MKSWFASYMEGHGAAPAEATVLASEKKITIGLRREGHAVTLHWDTRDIEAVFENNTQATRISKRNDRDTKLEIAGKDAFDFILQVQDEQNKPWHRKAKTKEWGRNGLLFLGIAGVLVAIYFLVVPWLAEKMASTVSTGTEEQFGNAVYNALDLSSQEDVNSSAVLNEFFREMNVPAGYTIRITVINSDAVNAFALPGGHIVVYSGLLSKLKTYPELAALLSHEFIHVNNKHATKSIFRQLGSRVFLSLLFGKFGNVASVMADQADNLKSLTYSRKLEKEADTEGLALLKERKIDPQGFIRLFQHLKNTTPAEGLPEFLASHPGIDSRMTNIRDAAAGAAAEESSGLKAIFDQLK
jgi:beta-barrel assembly-enhancing protease